MAYSYDRFRKIAAAGSFSNMSTGAQKFETAANMTGSIAGREVEIYLAASQVLSGEEIVGAYIGDAEISICGLTETDGAPDTVYWMVFLNAAKPSVQFLVPEDKTIWVALGNDSVAGLHFIVYGDVALTVGD